ncbi:phosphotransferase enzyme family protein [Peribacillus glennii]|nr:phosphotransferase [Peribacillus glennii]
MEKTVDLVFSSEILNEGADLFEVDRNSLTKLGDFENYIYRGKRDSLDVIVRYTHSSHRTYDLLAAEIDWVSFLKNKGFNVYGHFTSKNGQLVETRKARDETEFYISCFEMLPGRQIGWRNIEENGGLARIWGAAIGKLHRITKSYQPPTGKAARLQWDDDELIQIEMFKPDIESEIAAYRDRIIAQINSLEKTEDNYGLIHSDLHSGNFHIHGEDIFLFDFDDCSYHWFGSDIAIPLYYIVFQRDLHSKDGRDEFASRFFTKFIEGYKMEYILGPGTLESIPLFLKLRDIVLLSVLYKKFDFSRLSANERRFFEEVKVRVQQEEAIIDFRDLHFQ